MSRRDWIRVRCAWWTDPDHASLSGDALQIGPCLMMLADADPGWRDDGRAFIRGPDRRGLSVSGVALVVRWTPTRVAKAIQELVEVRTLQHDPERGYFFPNYRKHQENPSAKRVRKHRYSNAKVTGGVTPDVTVEVEEEAEVEADPPPTPKGRRTRRPPIDEAERAQAALVLGHLSKRVAEINPKATGFSAKSDANCREIVKRLRDGTSVDDMIAVINAKAAKCRGGGDGLQYLNPTTPFRDANWPRSIGEANAWQGSDGIEITESGYAKVDTSKIDYAASWAAAKRGDA